MPFTVLSIRTTPQPTVCVTCISLARGLHGVTLSTFLRLFVISHCNHTLLGCLAGSFNYDTPQNGVSHTKKIQLICRYFFACRQLPQAFSHWTVFIENKLLLPHARCFVKVAYVGKRETGWRCGVFECALLGAPVVRTRADAQRARSTTTHGRSRRGGAGGTRRARAERTEGTFRRDFSQGLLEGAVFIVLIGGKQG